MHSLSLFLIVITAGFTASGIIANLYRISGLKLEGTFGDVAWAAIVVFAGPNMIFECAMQGRIQKTWSAMAVWLVVAATCYWSMALGFIVLQLASLF